MTTDTLGRARAFELTILDHAAEMLPTTYGNAIIEAAVLIADLRDALTAALTREPSEADALTVGAAIQLAWSQHRDLPPIELTDDEMLYLGNAAITAMAPGSGGMGEG